MKKSSYTARSASTRARRTEREGSGITSPTLKRSFEVEETDSSTHPSPLSRRTTNPLRSSTSSTSSQRSYDLSSRNSDYSSSRSSPSESSNPRSPKTGMRRIELTGGRNPDTASSRRTEISIEVSSKQIDNSPSAGIARFGLKRPEVSLSSRSSPLDSSSNSISSSSSSSTNRRAELSMTRPSEPPAPPRRVMPSCPQPQSQGSLSPLREEQSPRPRSSALLRGPPGGQRCLSSDSRTVWCQAARWRTTTTRLLHLVLLCPPWRSHGWRGCSHLSQSRPQPDQQRCHSTVLLMAYLSKSNDLRQFGSNCDKII
ncbi:hypothetical protein D5F01_LYC18509 [Larimichthys crocea]|uniref:Uncharacterized protein n=1 Tax=Larimichthys crocea TaxID=215358 RepID=A0A6G0HV52_LARCR|nr:hypothetical protein D5F01_LYC18509 [Larimichthys crocea]